MKALATIAAVVLGAAVFGILPTFAQAGHHAVPLRTPRIFCQIGYRQVQDDCLKMHHGRVPPGQVRRELNPRTDRDDVAGRGVRS